MTVHRLGRRSAVGGRSDCRLPSAAKPRELPTALFLALAAVLWAASPAAAQFNGGATPTFGSPGFSAVTSAGGGGGGGGAYMAAPIMIQAYCGGTISATEYYSLATAGPAASFNNTTEANVKLPVPASGTLTGLVARGNGTAPTGTETWTVTVRDNAAATSLTCTISASSSPANVCQDFSDSVTISKTSPDLIDVQITPANTPTAEQFQFSLLFTATTGQEAPIFASAGSYSTALTATPIYIPIGLADETTPEEKAAVVMPAAGHIDDLYFSLSAAPGASATSQATVFHGNCTSDSATSLVATISGSNTLGTDLAPAHGFDVAAGDCVSIQLEATAGSPAAAFLNLALRWSPGTSGANYAYPEFLWGTTQPTTASAKYCGAPGQNGASCSSTESSTYAMIPGFGSKTMTAEDLLVWNDVDAGGGGRNWNARSGASPSGGAQANVNPSCTIGASAQSCSSTNSSTLTAGNYFDLYNSMVSGTGNSVTYTKGAIILSTQ